MPADDSHHDVLAEITRRCESTGRCSFPSPDAMIGFLGADALLPEDETWWRAFFVHQNAEPALAQTYQSMLTKESDAPAAPPYFSPMWNYITKASDMAKSSLQWTVKQSYEWSSWVYEGLPKREEPAADSDEEKGDVESPQKEKESPVIFVPAMQQMSSKITKQLSDLTAFRRVFTRNEWIDFLLEHRVFSAEAVTEHLILTQILEPLEIGSQRALFAKEGAGERVETAAAIAQWKYMTENLQSQVQMWENAEEVEDDDAAKTLFQERVRRNKLVSIECQKLANRLSTEENTTLDVAADRIEELMSFFPGTWPEL